MDNFCNVFIVMSQVTLTTTIITLPLMVLCSGALLIAMTVTWVPTSVGLRVLGQHDVVLLPQLILRYTMMGSASTVLCHSNNNLSLRFFLRHVSSMPWVLHR